MMPDPVTQQQFYKEIAEVKEMMLAQHRNLRASMDEGFRILSATLDGHERDDRLVADRVLIIEQERKAEKGEHAKKMVWITLVCGNALQAIWRIVEHALKAP